MRAYLGIDNGVSGSIALVMEGKALFVPTPTRTEQSYTRSSAKITRIDFDELEARLQAWSSLSDSIHAVIERPFVNPTGIKATISAVRALEATLICVERLGFSYEYIDSRQWQKELLPGVTGTSELKAASRSIGTRLFPALREEIKDHKDADSLLIAEWARRSGL